MERNGSQNKDLKNVSAATRHYGYIWDSLVINGNLLYKYSPESEGSEERTQFLVPLKLQLEVLKNLHSSVLAGHLGRKKTKSNISHYWFEMRETTNIYLALCDICEANKSPPKLPRASLGVMPVGAPLDRNATDLLGPLPETPRGNKYILTVTDYFTKWVEIFPVPDQTAFTCSQIIINEVICRLVSHTFRPG